MKKQSNTIKKVTFNITPQTSVRSTQGDKIYFRIPREKLRPEGLKRLLRLERYNEYKISLLALAKQKKFNLPEQGCHIIFYIPVPKSWKKYKQQQMHMMLHTSKPDVDNCLKAILDGLLTEDKHIADIRITKKWVNAPNGYIEFIVTNPSVRSMDTVL